MRRRIRVFCLALMTSALVEAAPASAVLEEIFNDDFASGDSCAWGPGSVTCPGFSVVTPPTEVAAGQIVARCYYFHTGNAAAIGVHRIASAMDANAVNVALYTTHDSSGTPTDDQPPGTLIDCPGEFGQYWRRLYMANDEDEEIVFPTDDGAGAPVGLEVGAGQPAVIFMRFANLSGSPVSPSVSISAYALPPEVAYTPTASYTTFNGNISIPPMTSGDEETYACPVPSGAKFWWFSTHTHLHATLAEIENGASPIVVTTDWQSPAVHTFDSPPFYTFGAGETLKYTCTYDNPGGSPIVSGEGYYDEHCMALAYFFPATAPRFCYNNILLP